MAGISFINFAAGAAAVILHHCDTDSNRACNDHGVVCLPDVRDARGRNLWLTLFGAWMGIIETNENLDSSGRAYPASSFLCAGFD